MRKKSNLKIIAAAILISVFFACSIFAGVVYVKKEGDAGPPPENGKGQQFQTPAEKLKSMQTQAGQSASDKNTDPKSMEEYGKVKIENNKKLSPQDSYKKYYFNQGDSSGKMIALTFDDGPSPKFTPWLLTILKEKNIKATFYLLGERVKLYPDLAKQIVSEGHQIGCHTFTHKNLRAISAAEIEKEINESVDLIEKTCGVKPVTFRPPFGNSNKAVVDACLKAGMNQIAFWSVDTDDWKPTTTREQIEERILNKTMGGSIILMHDKQSKTIEATAAVIDKLKEKGFQFVTMKELGAGKEIPSAQNEIPTQKTGGFSASAKTESSVQNKGGITTTPETQQKTVAEPELKTENKTETKAEIKSDITPADTPADSLKNTSESKIAPTPDKKDEIKSAAKAEQKTSEKSDLKPRAKKKAKTNTKSE